MARRQVLTVHPRPALEKNHLYRAKVQESRVNKKAATLDVTCVHVEKPQAGRPHNFRFGLPLYPDSPASQFLVACGLDAGQVGSQVPVGDAVGRYVGIKFHAGDLDETDVTFEQVSQPPDDANESTEAPPLSSTSERDNTISRKDLL